MRGLALSLLLFVGRGTGRDIRVVFTWLGTFSSNWTITGERIGSQYRHALPRTLTESVASLLFTVVILLTSVAKLCTVRAHVLETAATVRCPRIGFHAVFCTALVTNLIATLGTTGVGLMRPRVRHCTCTRE